MIPGSAGAGETGTAGDTGTFSLGLSAGRGAALMVEATAGRGAWPGTGGGPGGQWAGRAGRQPRVGGPGAGVARGPSAAPRPRTPLARPPALPARRPAVRRVGVPAAPATARPLPAPARPASPMASRARGSVAGLPGGHHCPLGQAWLGTQHRARPHTGVSTKRPPTSLPHVQGPCPVPRDLMGPRGSLRCLTDTLIGVSPL